MGKGALCLLGDLNATSHIQTTHNCAGFQKAQDLVLPKNQREEIGFHFVEKAIVFAVEDDTG